jgi:hypothetical protein
MERLRTPLLSAVRLLAVISAVGLAAGYVIFAQVNGSRQSVAPFSLPPAESQTAVLTQAGQLNAPRDLSSLSVQQVLQSSSKSGMLTHEATAIVAGGLMDVGSVRMTREAPPAPTPPPYLIPSSKTTVFRREVEAVISVTGMKSLPPAPTIPSIPQIPNAPPAGLAPLILPVATPLPAAR